MGSFASVNGIVTPAAEARVSIFDNGFTFGDSVYETLRTYGGRPFELSRHLRRLRASAGRLGFEIPLSNEVLARRLDELLAPAGDAGSYIRLIVTPGPRAISSNLHPLPGPPRVLA